MAEERYAAEPLNRLISTSASALRCTLHAADNAEKVTNDIHGTVLSRTVIIPDTYLRHIVFPLYRRHSVIAIPGGFLSRIDRPCKRIEPIVKNLKMSEERHVDLLGQGSDEKVAEVGHETDNFQVENLPKHVVDADPDEALKFVAAQYVFSNPRL